MVILEFLKTRGLMIVISHGDFLGLPVSGLIGFS